MIVNFIFLLGWSVRMVTTNLPLVQHESKHGLSDEKDLARYVNSFSTAKNGGCKCDVVTFRCECTVRMNPKCDKLTSFSVDTLTAALVVESLHKERMLKSSTDECTSEVPPMEEKIWPPKTSFKYEHKYLGELTGEEEPLLHLKVFPSQPTKIGTQFYFFQVRKSLIEKDSSQLEKKLLQFTLIHYDNETSVKDNVDKCDALYFIIHGFRQSQADDIFYNTRRYLLNYTIDASRSDWINCVVGVDWRIGAQMKPLSGILTEAAANTITVGRQIALLSYTLVLANKVEPGSIHLIGFSLGAQVAHFAAHWFKSVHKLVMKEMSTMKQANEVDWIAHLIGSNRDINNVSWKIGRVTGLDPAAREFSTYNGSHLLPDDANFVDIIHTSACEYSGSYIDVLNARFGMSEPVGTVDFYPNGGSSPQPECSLDRTNVGCSHNRAIIFFTDSLDQSLDSRSFLSYPCASYSSCNSSELSQVSETDERFSSMGILASRHGGRGVQYLNYTSRDYKRNYTRPCS